MTEQEKPDMPGVPGCGRQLRRTREKLGLSVNDVAAELRLSGFQIQALEDDDWSQLPGTTYARGYLRSYARLIGLDADQLMAGASTQEIEISRKEPEIDMHRARASASGGDGPAAAPSGGSPWRWVGVLGAVAVMAAGYWQYREGGSLIPGAGQTADGLPPADIAGDNIERAAAMEDRAREAAPEAGPDASGTAGVDDEADGGAPPTPTVPGKAVFQFEDRSWIDVRDASGARLLYRNYPPGRRIEIEGQPPFRVYLGNAGAVRVEYMGDIVSPDTQPGRLYARFVLGPPSG